MKAEIRVRPHGGLSGQNLIEVFYDGHFIATVVGADGPGIRIVSRYLNASTTGGLTIKGTVRAVKGRSTRSTSKHTRKPKR